MKIKFILLTVVILLSFQDIFAQTKTKRLIIGDTKKSCIYNNTIMACFQAKVHKDSSWKDFPYQISGFNFEPGYESELELQEIYDYSDSLQSLKYKLITIINTEKTIITNPLVLTNNKWNLLNAVRDVKNIPLRKKGIYFRLDSTFTQFSGFASCNDYSGKVKIDDGVIEFGIMVSTKMSCDNIESENLLLDAFKGKAAFYVRNNILFVICENGTTLHFRPEKKLDSIIEVIKRPKNIFDGNTYTKLGKNMYQVTLSELPDYKNKPMIFNEFQISEKEKTTYRLILKNPDPKTEVLYIKILKRNSEKTDFLDADIIFKNGTKQRVLIQNIITN